MQYGYLFCFEECAKSKTPCTSKVINDWKRCTYSLGTVHSEFSL